MNNVIPFPRRDIGRLYNAAFDCGGATMFDGLEYDHLTMKVHRLPYEGMPERFSIERGAHEYVDVEGSRLEPDTLFYIGYTVVLSVTADDSGLTHKFKATIVDVTSRKYLFRRISDCEVDG